MMLSTLLVMSLVFRNTNVVSAFVPATTTTTRKSFVHDTGLFSAQPSTDLPDSQQQQQQRRRQVLTRIGTAVVAAWWPLTAAPTVVHASAYKELDMSMPNYSDVKSPKASVETVKSLYVDKSPTNTPTNKVSASSEKMPDAFALFGGVVGGDKKKKPKEKKEKTDAQGYILF